MRGCPAEVGEIRVSESLGENKGRAVSSERTWSTLRSQLKVMMLVTFLWLYCPTHFSGEVYSTSSWSSAHTNTHTNNNNNNNNNKENFECLTFQYSLKCVHNHDKQSYKACSQHYCTVTTNQNAKLQYSSTVINGKLSTHRQTHTHTHRHAHTHTHTHACTHTHICTHSVV